MMFAINDRVVRMKYINDRQSLRHGVVTEVYPSAKNLDGVSLTLYAVRWDDTGLVERGYLATGLEQEPLVIAGANRGI